MRLRRCTLLALSMICFVGMFAQDNVFVYGSIKDYMTSRKIPNGTVIVYKNGSKLVEVPANASGKFEVNLDYGAEYKLLWKSGGYVSKNIEIDTRGVTEEDRVGGHGMNIDITLLTELPGVDFTLLKQAFGKAKFASEDANFTWDMEYTEQMRSAQAKLIKEYENKLKNADKLEEDYKKAMQQGEEALVQKNYKKAVASFNDALAAKPDDAIATAKLSDAEIGLKEEGAAAELEAQYQALIKSADDLFKKADFAGAKSKYKESLDYKEGEAYPKAQMKACDAKIEELKKQEEAERLAKENQEKYDAAVKAGDAAFSSDKLDEAEAKYQEALKLKPQETYPPGKLSDIKARRAELAAKEEEERKAKELQAKYDAAVKAGDAAFKSASYDQAKSKYQEALTIKADESYPQDQLKAIEVKLEELKAKEDEERLARELQAKYDAAITAADASFNAAQYDAARGKYEEALGLKADESYPKTQLKAIEAKLEEIKKAEEEAAKQKELDERYNAIIVKADGLFGAADYEKAIAEYESAGEVKPDESYPKAQLKAIQDKLDEIAKREEEERLRKELQEKYDAAIAKADEAFGAESWEQAKAAYQTAKGIKADESYPDTKLGEIQTILDRLAAEEAERKKQEELQARYDAKITSADQAYESDNLESAIMDYKDALTIKPGETYPQGRIKDIESKMDAAAQANAEAERLKREAEELEARYNDLINSGDQAFAQEKWSDARIAYTDALVIKDEQHPKDKLAAIEERLAADADAAEEARLAAEQAEKDRLAADAEAQRLADVEAQRLADEAQAERDRLAAEADEANRLADDEAAAEQRYRNIIAEADNAFSAEDFDKARTKYTEAISVKPEDSYPKGRLTEIENLLAQRASSVANEARLAEERRLAEEERLRKLQEQEDADRLAAQAERDRLTASQASEAEYDRVILDADKSFGESDYTSAKALYSQAVDMKPEEVYPKGQLERIAALQAELDRKKREAEEARLAAAEAERKRSERTVRSTVKQGESDAERFMREAREREEAEKYERIKKVKASVQETSNTWVEGAQERQDGRVSEGEASGAGLFVGSQDDRLARMAEVERQKEELRKLTAEREARAKEGSDEARLNKVSVEESLVARADGWNSDQAEHIQATLAEKKRIREDEQERARGAQDRSEEMRQKATKLTEYQRGLKTRADEQAKLAHARVQAEKEKLESSTSMQSNTAKTQREAERERLANIPLNKERDTRDFNQSQLAQNYPQGVTEESYSEGNKVVIRRVVVIDNKADEYSKVIAKWGTFYFKNGHSISETIWSNETDLSGL